jgi:hypothetical protein
MKTMEENFLEFKEEILRRAKGADACESEYKKAYKSEYYTELMQVIKDNFSFACNRKIIDSELIKKFEKQFNKNSIFCNVNISEGFLLLCGQATAEIYGYATAVISGNATAEIYGYATAVIFGHANAKISGHATAEISGQAIAEINGQATAEIYGNAYIQSNSIIECKLSENAIHRIIDKNTIRYASDDIKFEKVS